MVFQTLQLKPILLFLLFFSSTIIFGFLVSNVWSVFRIKPTTSRYYPPLMTLRHSYPIYVLILIYTRDYHLHSHFYLKVFALDSFKSPKKLLKLSSPTPCILCSVFTVWLNFINIFMYIFMRFFRLL